MARIAPSVRRSATATGARAGTVELASACQPWQPDLPGRRGSWRPAQLNHATGHNAGYEVRTSHLKVPRSAPAGGSSAAVKVLAGQFKPPRTLLAGLSLFIILSPFDRLSLGTVAGAQVRLADATVLLIAPALAVLVFRHWRSWLLDSFVQVLVAWLAINLIGAWRSPAGALAIAKFAGVGWLAVLALSAAILFRDRAAQLYLRAAWCAALAVVVAIFLATLAMWVLGARDLSTLATFGSLPPGRYPRIRGPFMNANMACTWLLAALAVAISSGPALGLSRNQLFTLIGLGGASSALTASPGLAGLFAGLAMSRSRLPHSLRLYALVLAIGGLAVMALATTLLVRSTPAGWRVEPAPRASVWESAAETAASAFPLGNGLGTEPANHSWTSPAGELQLLTDAHQAYLSILAQLGMPGLVAWLALLAIAFLRARHEDPWLAVGIVAAVVIPSLSGSFEDARHLWVLVGMAAGSVPANRYVM